MSDSTSLRLLSSNRLEAVPVFGRDGGTLGTVAAIIFDRFTGQAEAVVSKDARVVEEVLLHKDVDSRTETVSDTLRRTEVEVENLPGRGSASRYGTAATGTTAAVGHDPDVSLGEKVADLAKESAGKVTGNEDLERRGEAQQGKPTAGY